MIGKRTVYIARRLTHVNSLSEITMKKGILNIKLMNRPVTGDGDAKNRADSGRFDNWTESVIKVQTRLLRETLSNKTGFVTLKTSITVKLMAKQPTIANYVSIRGFRNKIPRVVRNNSSHFSIHGGPPMRVTHGLSSRPRNGRDVTNHPIKPIQFGTIVEFTSQPLDVCIYIKLK
ncbi:hypothetical protein OSB04_001314 [Centaurea solstitialis]|uniref:Uncharacterized protein n=1 Tax=Centaurea solstitialis TaxID=347529 RepID=A0AA38TQR8_9ASTR|nr:hypothetical protein OSB04_001314 [Centaurea solstitialis]